MVRNAARSFVRRTCLHHTRHTRRNRAQRLLRPANGCHMASRSPQTRPRGDATDAVRQIGSYGARLVTRRLLPPKSVPIAVAVTFHLVRWHRVDGDDGALLVDHHDGGHSGCGTRRVARERRLLRCRPPRWLAGVNLFDVAARALSASRRVPFDAETQSLHLSHLAHQSPLAFSKTRIRRRLGTAHRMPDRAPTRRARERQFCASDRPRIPPAFLLAACAPRARRDVAAS